MTNEKDIDIWVVESLKNEDITNLTITISGYSEKGDNYAGEITFVSAKGNTKSGKNTELALVVKTGKRENIINGEMNMKPIYIRELYLYNIILPTIQEYQRTKKSKNVFSATAKCYKAFREEDVEVLVLENLKSKGYALHDRQVSMNVNHIKLVLNNYAKYHAVSFVMRDQNPQKFNEITSNMKPLLKGIFIAQNVVNHCNNMYNECLKYIRKVDPELGPKMKNIIGDSITEALFEAEDSKVSEAVITHGDCWNNNFMFKYVDDDHECPKDVKILDWQMSCLHTPVFDLSYLIYMVSSKQELDKFDELLEYYYKNLSFFIEEMGSDLAALFPYSTLLSHWNKYSIYGFSFVITSLQLLLCDKNDAPCMDDNFEIFLNQLNLIKSKNKELYEARLHAAVTHFCTWNRN